MASLTDFGERLALNVANGGAATATLRWLALYTAAPGEGGGGTQVSGGSYARRQIDFNFAATSGGTTTAANAGAITFPTATSSWGTVTHFGIFDASTGGNLIWYGPLSASKTIQAGDVLVFNNLSISSSMA
jgi:hypothetical protein